MSMSIPQRRLSEAVDLDAAEALSGAAPFRIEPPEGLELIAEQYARIEGTVTSELIRRRLEDRMAEHCELVRELVGLSAGHEVVYCPEGRCFYAFKRESPLE